MVYVIVIQLMFLGINMFLALLRTHFTPHYTLGLGPKHTWPRTSTLLLYYIIYLLIRNVLYFFEQLDAWLKILEPVESQRKDTNRVNLFPGYITGEVGNLLRLLYCCSRAYRFSLSFSLVGS